MTADRFTEGAVKGIVQNRQEAWGSSQLLPQASAHTWLERSQAMAFRRAGKGVIRFQRALEIIFSMAQPR